MVLSKASLFFGLTPLVVQKIPFRPRAILENQRKSLRKFATQKKRPMRKCLARQSALASVLMPSTERPSQLSRTWDKKTEVSYPADLGGSCDQWEAESHPTCKGNSPPAWCKESWCYVDPRNCHLQILPKKAVYQPGALYQTLPLYYSYSTCGATDTWTVGAPDVGQQGCRCIGLDGMPGVMDVKIDGSTVQYPAEMGGTCQAWDAVNHPTCMGPDKADWCTKKWCYVDPCACNAAAPPKSAQFLGDATFQGRNVFWSYATCGETDTYSTPEHQASSKAEIERSCVASQAPPTAQGTVFSKRASTETDAKSGAHGLRTILAIMALCSSLLK